jgi:uncharacterized protein (TIGR03086 family)
VAGEGRAEAAAEEQEVLPGGCFEFAVDRAAGEVQGLAEALVDIAELGAERDQAAGVGIYGQCSFDHGAAPTEAKAPRRFYRRTRGRPMIRVMTDLLSLHRRTMATATAIVELVGEDQLRMETPCAGWDLSQLLAHMIGQNHGFASAARGEAFDLANWADRPVSTRPHEAFAASAAEVVDAFASPGAVEREWPILVGADRSLAVPGRQALGFHFIDYVVHAWDVAVSIGVKVEFDDDILTAVLPLAQEVPLEGPTRNGPYAPFAPAVTLEAPQGNLNDLLAILGRDPAWKPN